MGHVWLKLLQSSSRRRPEAAEAARAFRIGKRSLRHSGASSAKGMGIGAMGQAGALCAALPKRAPKTREGA